MFRLVIVVNILIQFGCTHPLNYGAHTPEFYNSLSPQQRYQRSFPGFYNNGMFQQQLNPIYHSHPMEMNNRPVYRRNIYDNNGFRPQFEQQSPVGMYGPPPTMHQSKPMGQDESHLIVLPRGADEEYAWNPLKTKMIDGFDEEDQDMMQEEEMGDALSYIDSQTPTRYTSERILKSPKHSAPSLHMEMAQPTTRMPMPPAPMGYNVPQSYGSVPGMPQHHMMMPHSENYQGNYQMQQFDQENMYPTQNYHHQHQKRYQPHHQYYQNPRYNQQFENPHHYFETPNEDEMMYPLPTRKKYARTKIEPAPQEVIFAEDGNDDFYDDDEITIEGDTIALLSDSDSPIIVEDNSNSIDNISSNTVEHESVEISEDNTESADDDIKNTENNTTNEPENDNVEEEDDLEEVQEEEDVSSSEN